MQNMRAMVARPAHNLFLHRPGTRMSMHESDLSDDPALLQWMLDDARQEIARLRGETLVIKVAGTGQLPTRAYEGDAGFDLYVNGDWSIARGDFLDIPCGIQIEMPPGYWARIVGRSSTMRSRGLLVLEGTIDGGFRGEIFCAVQNMSSHDVVIKDGERLAQLIPQWLDAARMRMARVDQLSESDRGAKGFGSSGT